MFNEAPSVLLGGSRTSIELGAIRYRLPFVAVDVGEAWFWIGVHRTNTASSSRRFILFSSTRLSVVELDALFYLVPLRMAVRTTACIFVVFVCSLCTVGSAFLSRVFCRLLSGEGEETRVVEITWSECSRAELKTCG